MEKIEAMRVWSVCDLKNMVFGRELIDDGVRDVLCISLGPWDLRPKAGVGSRSARYNWARLYG